MYDEVKNDENYSDLSFVELMKKIGTYQDGVDIRSIAELYTELQKYESVLKKFNSGFVVFMHEISMVLENTIKDESFFEELQWLLPVDFCDELYDSDKKELFEELTTEKLKIQYLLDIVIYVIMTSKFLDLLKSLCFVIMYVRVI